MLRAEPERQNGSHSPAEVPQPEVAAGKAGGPAVNLSSSGGVSAKPHARLVIERGKSVGKQFMLSSAESNIGRWDADGGIFPDVDLDSDDPEAKVSRRHARITFSDGNYLLEDLGSTNGTFINRGKRLSPGTRQPLNDGDEIIVGKTFLRFHVVK
jgi:pSer/pThr/pTyr-binding forkhead associated (FHA) protein